MLRKSFVIKIDFLAYFICELCKLQRTVDFLADWRQTYLTSAQDIEVSFHNLLQFMLKPNCFYNYHLYYILYITFYSLFECFER